MVEGVGGRRACVGQAHVDITHTREGESCAGICKWRLRVDRGIWELETVGWLMSSRPRPEDPGTMVAGGE